MSYNLVKLAVKLVVLQEVRKPEETVAAPNTAAPDIKADFNTKALLELSMFSMVYSKIFIKINNKNSTTGYLMEIYFLISTSI